MGTRGIENRIRKLKAIEEQQRALKAQAEAIKAAIRKEMEAQGTDEIHTPNLVVRLKEIVLSRFDKSFKGEHKSLYEAYTKSSITKRFTVA